VYFAFEIIGCILACSLFRLCRPADFVPGADEDCSPSTVSQLASEFLGTYFLVLTVGLNVLSDSKAAAYSIAAALMCMIYALGSVSGAHFNPAVTLAIKCSGRDMITAGTAAAYMVAQVLGGVLAGFTYAYLMNGKTVPLAPKMGEGAALSGEMIFTFLLSFVVLSVATITRYEKLAQFFGLAIGACVISGGYAIGNISGGSLIPQFLLALP